MLYVSICSLALYLPQPTLIFQLIIDDGRCLKYAYNDRIYQSIDSRNSIELRYLYQCHATTGYSSKNFIHVSNIAKIER